MKLIAASVALMTSFGAVAGLGGLNVQSNLGEPFSGSITVTGEEAKALLNGGKATVSNGNLRTSVRKSGDKAIISIRSSQPIQDPVLIFQVGAGSQSREYTAIIDPADYASKPDGSTRARTNNNNQAARVEPAASAPKSQNVDREAARERISRIVNSEESEYQESVQAGKPKIPGRQVQAANEREYSNISYGRRHLVVNGETLLGISARIRPQGMSVGETMRALVNANPTVFIENNADRMLAGKVLNIPTRDEMKRLAAQAPAVKVPAENAAQASDQAQQSAQKPQQPAEQQPSIVTPPEEKPASDVRAKDKNAQQTEPEAVKPVEQGDAAASGAAAKPASDADAAASSAGQLPKQGQAEPSEENTPAEEGSLWRWLLIGGAALVVLLLLAKLLAGRKAQQQVAAPIAEQAADEDDEDDFSFINSADSAVKEQSFTAAEVKELQEAEGRESAGKAGFAESAAHTDFNEKAAVEEPSAEEGLDIEDDFDDDIFFTQAAEEAVAGKDDVKVDWNSVEGVQTGIVSSAVTTDEETEKRRNADWDAIESTESVYEPDTENQYQPPPSAESAVIEREAGSSVADVPDREETKEEVLDFFAADKVEEEGNEGAHFSVSQQSDQEQKEIFDANEGSETVSDEPLAFEMPSHTEEGESDEAVEEEIGGTEETPSVEADSPTEVFEIKQNQSLSFQDGVDFEGQTLQVDENVEWEDIAVEDVDSASHEGSSFISESVGMTAPLEAKYELAKMYVEIGDPVAARETLQELLEESQGAILDKAKAMLKELDS